MSLAAVVVGSEVRRDRKMVVLGRGLPAASREKERRRRKTMESMKMVVGETVRCDSCRDGKGEKQCIRVGV